MTVFLSPAHPRSRGENDPTDPSHPLATGSSPLTRGKLSLATRFQLDHRLIPAHAGKTRSRACLGRSGWAHPRSRGENAPPRTYRCRVPGSSPLTRGKPGHLVRWSGRDGLIPAHAGKTNVLVAPSSSQEAHPRSRGENRDVEKTFITGTGSSPLTRGKLARWKRAPRLQGLIPAHAGKTPPESPPSRSRRAHPRSRGENSIEETTGGLAAGSSPLTRGKPHRHPVRARRPGLIPAHAGKTSPTCNATPITWAHPRSRGENDEAGKPVAADDGSSPLTRGKPW